MKRVVIIVIASVLALIGIAGSAGNTTQQSNTKSLDNVSTSTAEKEPAKKTVPTCDGTAVTADCTAEGISYKTYIYHEAVPEKSHIETTTTYEEKVTGYCTLCNDGTRSPTCATGSGTCSHHDGVAEWNAPITSRVPHETSETIVDSPAVEAYYEKVTQ